MSTINERRSRRAVGTSLLKKCTVGLAILLSTQAPTIHATSTEDDQSPQTHRMAKTINNNNNFGQHRKGESNSNKRVLEESYMPTYANADSNIPTITPTSIIDDTEQPSPAPISMLSATPNPTVSTRPTSAPIMADTMPSAGTTSNSEPPTPKSWPFNPQPQPTIGTSPYTIQPISVSKPSAQQSTGGNVNSYCGSDWADAWKNCPKACPGGEDAECASLGEGYNCQDYTGCNEKVGGSNSPPAPTPPGPTPAVPASTIAPTPKPSGQPVKPVEQIAFPACVPEYATGNDYSFGALVSNPTSDGSGTVEVFECQGDLCNAGPTHAPGGDSGHLTWTFIGTCTPSSSMGGGENENGVVCPGASVADPNARWWLRNENGTPECICGVSYRDRYDMTNPDLVERFIFMSENQCCDRYPNVCDPSLGVPMTTMAPSPSVASGGSMFPAPNIATASPDGSNVPTLLSNVPTYAEDDDEVFDDDSSASVKGQVFILGAVTVAIALFL